MIAFYSSQQRSLYIEDIYRVLSLPQNFVIQFRYPESIVEKDIRRNIHSIINQDSIIFYTVKESNGELKNIPIRNAKIKDVYISEELEYINFYLELGNFVDCEVSLQMNSLAKCPPQIFVSQLNITQSVSQKWLDTIVKVAPYFEELKFIYIKSFKNSKNGTVQKFKYNPFHKRSFLNLNDEQEYTIEILSYDKTKGNNEISIGKDEKTIDITTSITRGNELDTSFIKMNTNAIDFRNKNSFVEFKTTDDKSTTYSVYIPMEIKRRRIKSFLFGFMTMIGSAGLLSGTYISKNSDLKEFLIWGSISVIAIGTGAGFLHWLFNKK